MYWDVVLLDPSNAKSVGLETARQSLDTAIRGAFHNAGLTPAPVEVICLGLAGFDRPDDRKVLSEWAEQAGWARRVLIVNDGDLVIAAGTPEGWGIGIIAGTGSIAVGRTKDGRTARAGGWGHLIGDEGSAYRFVLDALRLVARRADGRDTQPTEHDPFTERICAALGVNSASQIITTIYSPEFTRARIASLAPEILAACAEATRDSCQSLKLGRHCPRRNGCSYGPIARLDVRIAPTGDGRRFSPGHQACTTSDGRPTYTIRLSDGYHGGYRPSPRRSHSR